MLNTTELRQNEIMNTHINSGKFGPESLPVSNSTLIEKYKLLKSDPDFMEKLQPFLDGLSDTLELQEVFQYEVALTTGEPNEFIIY